MRPRSTVSESTIGSHPSPPIYVSTARPDIFSITPNLTGARPAPAPSSSSSSFSSSASSRALGAAAVSAPLWIDTSLPPLPSSPASSLGSSSPKRRTPHSSPTYLGSGLLPSFATRTRLSTHGGGASSPPFLPRAPLLLRHLASRIPPMHIDVDGDNFNTPVSHSAYPTNNQ